MQDGSSAPVRFSCKAFTGKGGGNAPNTVSWPKAPARGPSGVTDFTFSMHQAGAEGVCGALGPSWVLWCCPQVPRGQGEGTWGTGTTLGAVGSQEAALDAPMPKQAEAWRGGNGRGCCQSTPALLAARMGQEQGLNPQQPMIEAHLMTLLNDTVHFLPLKVLNICARVIHYYYLIKDYLTHFHVSSNYKLKLFPLWPCSC